MPDCDAVSHSIEKVIPMPKKQKGPEGQLGWKMKNTDSFKFPPLKAINT
jgi:hypothetical protein